MSEKATDSDPSSKRVIPRKLHSRLFSPFDTLESEKQWWYPRSIQNLFNEPIFADPLHLIEGSTPRVDIVDKDKEIIVKAEVPGMQGENIEVLVGDRTLTLRGSHTEEKESEEG
ncbi:MAG TPA: hypothetical protein DCZ03_04715, partial [Gammaproteobacteria bacterium]|nr:hypothetical protein [Gammaproteobacteria bacterium]